MYKSRLTIGFRELPEFILNLFETFEGFEGAFLFINTTEGFLALQIDPLPLVLPHLHGFLSLLLLTLLITLGIGLHRRFRRVQGNNLGFSWLIR